MNKTKARFLLPAILAAALAPAAVNAGIVTNDSQVTLTSGDILLVGLSVNDPSGGDIQMMLGTLPLDGATSPVPGTSGVYVPGILFSGTLESQHGSVPLFDTNAARLGLPDGNIVLVPGSRNGGFYSGPIDLLSAGAPLSSGSRNVVIELENIGANVTFGYPGSTLANDFSASLTTCGGLRSMGARVMSLAIIQTPEPGTIGLLLIGVAVLSGHALRRSRS